MSILEEASRWIRTASNKDPRQVGAASVEYLHLFGYVSYAYLWS
ncbi:acyl-CoA dehydrogenase C-terminal domain-containing protein, partial [Pseudomonas sp. ERMR1:02]